MGLFREKHRELRLEKHLQMIWEPLGGGGHYDVAGIGTHLGGQIKPTHA